MTIAETLKELIQETEQLVLDNKKLNEDILILQKEKDEGYKSFNTETHILVERKVLEELSDSADNIYSQLDDASRESEDAASYADNASSSCGYARDDAYSMQKDIDKLLRIILGNDKEEAA
jgi:hypothetical protein